MHLIVTGFEKFSDFAYNPSQLAVETLPDKLKLANSGKAISVARIILNGWSGENWRPIQEELDRHGRQPVVLVMSGLASRRDRISLERFALNIRDFAIPDNRGRQIEDELIDPDGPEAIRTNLPLVPLNKRLNGNGYLSAISNHAGAFLCNEIYYQSLRQHQLGGQPAASIFVHLPWPEAYAASQAGQSETSRRLSEAEIAATINAFGSALQEIGSFCLEWLSGKNDKSSGLIKSRLRKANRKD